MRVAIFGGGGFLGRYLTSTLLAMGCSSLNIYGRNVKESKFQTAANGNVKIFNANFSDNFTVAEALRNTDVIFHLISTTIPATSNENPVKDIEENLLPTIKFLECIRNSNVKKLIFFSSGGTVYGPSLGELCREDDPTNPICSYGIHKLAIEKYLNLFNVLHGLDYRIMRIGNPYGMNQNISKQQGFVQTAITKSLSGLPIQVWGDGSIVRDYLHAEDVARAAVKLIAYSGDHRIFNIGSGEGYSINEILGVIENASCRNLNIQYSPSRTFDLQSNVLDISLAKKELNWVPSIDIKQYIEEQIKFWPKSNI